MSCQAVVNALPPEPNIVFVHLKATGDFEDASHALTRSVANSPYILPHGSDIDYHLYRLPAFPASVSCACGEGELRRVLKT